MRPFRPFARAAIAAVFFGGAVVVPALTLTGAGEDQGPISGFTAKGVIAQRKVESVFAAVPSTSNLESDHRFLTEKPHVAGSPRDRELAEWIRDRWQSFGLDEVEIVEHEVLLPYPEAVTVEMTAPKQWRASMTEDPIEGDSSEAAADVGIPYHAYSASGDVTAPVVYAGSGNPDDYDWLASRGIDIKGKIALVRYSVPYSYRGFKALTAERRGAAGILIYSDPADDGFKKGEVYPKGPWGPESHIQRGGIVYDFIVPGDPLTPGWASVAGAKRIAPADAISLPHIMSAPLSYKDARVILESLDGPAAPDTWQGGLPFEYHVGGGATTVHMQMKMDDKVRPIWTVIGRVRGAAAPDEWVILGNHRDAWVYGGVDPSSGTATMMEVARGLGTLVREGLRPKRTVVLASWDAEEFTLTSSTEWGEQFEKELSTKAVAYLNVDSSASGPNFSASAVPSLNRLVEESAQSVMDPSGAVTVLAAARDRKTAEDRGMPSGGGDQIVSNRLGSGSDYTVFLNYLGIPIVDMSFDGPYGVYHSIYDNHQWVSRIGDPGFKYHAAMARLWGIMALRLANADLLPFDYTAYSARVGEFLTELNRRWEGYLVPIGSDGEASDQAEVERIVAAAFTKARQAVDRLSKAAAAFEKRSAAAMKLGTPAGLTRLNRTLLTAERAWLNPEGIPERPWYRHLIYAPKYTYAPEVLPGVAAALDASDRQQLVVQLGKLTAAANKLTKALGGP
jgi:N-acetylated-alpha-linked acidic dipeptidase